jgi:hypothetical protein
VRRDVLRLLCCRQDRSFNVQWFKEDFDIDAEQIEALYQFTKFQFDCGNYGAAAELLNVSTRQKQQQQQQRRRRHGGRAATAPAAATLQQHQQEQHD